MDTEKKIKDAQNEFLHSLRQNDIEKYKQALNRFEALGKDIGYRALANVYFAIDYNEAKWEEELDQIERFFRGKKAQYFESAYPVMIIGNLAKGFKNQNGREATNKFCNRFQKGIGYLASSDNTNDKKRMAEYCRYSALCIRNVDGISIMMRHALLCFVYERMMKSSLSKDIIYYNLVEETVNQYLNTDKDGFEKVIDTRFSDEHFQKFADLLKAYSKSKSKEISEKRGKSSQILQTDESKSSLDRIIMLYHELIVIALVLVVVFIIIVFRLLFGTSNKLQKPSVQVEERVERSLTDSSETCESTVANESGMDESKREYVLIICSRRILRQTTNNDNAIIVLEKGSQVTVLDDTIGDGWARVRYDIDQEEDGYTFTYGYIGYLKIMPEDVNYDNKMNTEMHNATFDNPYTDSVDEIFDTEYGSTEREVQWQ